MAYIPPALRLADVRKTAVPTFNLLPTNLLNELIALYASAPVLVDSVIAVWAAFLLAVSVAFSPASRRSIREVIALKPLRGDITPLASESTLAVFGITKAVAARSATTAGAVVRAS